ncbi:MAG TPA: hypothetical protein P5274_02120 [Candidatus Paceibacterota bacterium]|nr:hypothetical protein [Candidatus Paceibacterota bacterium]
MRKLVLVGFLLCLIFIFFKSIFIRVVYYGKNDKIEEISKVN